MDGKHSKIMRVHPSLYEMLSKERKRIFLETGRIVSWTSLQKIMLDDYERRKFKLKSDKGVSNEIQFRV